MEQAQKHRQTRPEPNARRVGIGADEESQTRRLREEAERLGNPDWLYPRTERQAKVMVITIGVAFVLMVVAAIWVLGFGGLNLRAMLGE